MRLGDEWEPEVNRHILDLVHCSKKPLPFTHFALAHDYFADIPCVMTAACSCKVMDRFGNEPSSNMDSSSDSLSNHGSRWHVFYGIIISDTCFTADWPGPSTTTMTMDLGIVTPRARSESVVSLLVSLAVPSVTVLMIPSCYLGGVLVMIRTDLIGGTRRFGRCMRCTISLPSLGKVMLRSIMPTMRTLATMTDWRCRSPI